MESSVIAPIRVSPCYDLAIASKRSSEVIAPIRVSPCYDYILLIDCDRSVIAPIRVSPCYDRWTLSVGIFRVFGPQNIKKSDRLWATFSLFDRFFSEMNPHP